jgi:hypothetical protein
LRLIISSLPRLIVITALGMFLSAWPAFSNSLYLPLMEHDLQHETGVAVANTATAATSVTLTLYDQTGKQVGRTQRTLAANGQLADSLSDFFGLPDTFNGWLQIDATAEVAALSVLFQNNTGQSSSLPVFEIPSMIQYLPHVAIGNAWNTSVTVTNISTQICNATLVLYDAGGNLVSNQKVQLPPQGESVLDVGALFQIASLIGGHLEVVTDQPVVASGSIGNENSAATFGAQTVGTSGADGKWTQWFAYTASDSTHWTGLAWVNVSAAPSLVRVDLLASDGSLVASQTELLPSKAEATLVLGDFASTWQGMGYVRVSADASMAALTITGSSSGGLTTLTASAGQTQGASELYVPDLAETGGWSSSLTLLNLTPSTANVTLQAFDGGGNMLSTAPLTLGPNQQLSKVLASLLPVSGQSGGSVQITSNVPIIATNQFTSAQGVFSVAAEPPMDISDRTISAIVLASQTVGAAGGVLSPNLPGGQDNYLNRLQLSIPPGALTSATNIQLLITAPISPLPSSNLSLQQYPIRLLPSGLQFRIPALLTIPLPSTVVRNVAQLHSLVASTSNEVTPSLEALPIVGYDDINNTVTLQITHFSTDQVEAFTSATQVVDHVADLFGEGSDLYTEINLLLNQNEDDPEISELGTLIGAVDTATHMANDYASGQYFQMGADATEFVAQTALTGACDAITDSAASAACGVIVDGVFNQAIIPGINAAGNWLATIITTWQNDHDSSTLVTQLSRYVTWRQRGYSSGNVPTCHSNWFEDPATSVCTAADNGICVLSLCPYPDFLTSYTPQVVASYGDITYSVGESLAANLQSVKSALIATVTTLVSKYSNASPLSASFTISPSTQGSAPFSVSVQAAATTGISSYIWDFGDGTRLIGSSNISHTFLVPGPYSIQLTVENTQGNLAHSSQLLSVAEPQNISIQLATGPPQITASTSTVSIPGSVVLTASGFNPAGAIEVYWSTVGGALSSSPILQAGLNGTATYTLPFGSSTPVGQYNIYAEELGGSKTNTIVVGANSSVPPPQVNSLTPSQATLSSNAQSVSFTTVVMGSGFASGASTRVYFATSNTAPGDLALVVPSSVIQGTATQLTVPLTLGQGHFNLVVVNPDQQQSQPLPLTVSGSQLAGPTLSSLTINPATIAAGGSVTITLTLSGPAPSPAGASVSLSSTVPFALPLPQTLVVQPGQTSASTTVTVGTIGVSTPVVVTASYGNSTRTAMVTVTPSGQAAITSLALIPTTLASGGSSMLTVVLNAAAPSPTGAVVSLSSSDPSAFPLPSMLVVQPGQTTVNTTITAGTVAASTVVTVVASYNGSSQSGTVTITPFASSLALSSVSITPSRLASGAIATLSVTITGTAPSGGAVVNLQTSSATAFPVPSMITIPSGKSTNGISVQAGVVTASTAVTITASFGGSNQTANVTITPGSGNQLLVTPSVPWQPQFTAGGAPATLAIQISSQNAGTLTGTVVAATANGQQWLTVDGHASETWVAPEGISMTANPAGLSPGTYLGSITVTAAAATNSPVTIPVTMTILAPLQITTTSLTTATWGQPFSFQLQATGGSGYVWSLQSGSSLPSNLTLSSSGLISGTLILGSSTVTYPFTVVVTDAQNQSAFANLSLKVQSPILVTTFSPSNFQFDVGVTYVAPSSGNNSMTFQASGGAAPYTWAGTGLPPGLSMDSPSATLVGTPTQPGTFSATITATDSQGRTGSGTFSLVVVTYPLYIEGTNGQRPPTLPPGTVGVLYSQSLGAVGGSYAGYQWSVTGSVPPGLTAQANTTAPCTPNCGFLISGTPTQMGTFNFTVQVKDSLGNTAQQPLVLIINSGTPPQITTSTLTLGTVGQAYSFTFAATAGAGGYVWSFNGPSPDSGLQLFSSGVLQGTSNVPNDCPTGPGVWIGNQPPFGSFSSTYFQVQVTDAAGQSVSKQFCLPSYYPTPTVTGLTPPSVIVDGQSHTVTLNGSNFRSSAYLSNGGAFPATYLSGNALTFALTPSTTAAFGVSGGGLGEGTHQFWVVQPYSSISNQGSLTIYDPPPTISSVQAVLNNSDQPCTSNLNCQLIINGSGFVFSTQYQTSQGGLCIANSPSTPIPWSSVTTCAFSLPSPGTYTLTVTNGNQPGGGSAQATAQFTLSQ